MIYERVNWLNKGETGAKPINKTNLNQMDKGIYDLQNIELIGVEKTAPTECTTGDKYFNTTDKKIYTATADNTWGETGETPLRGILYVIISSQTSYYYDGDTLISIGGGASGGTSIPVSATPPENPEDGALWVDTDDEGVIVEVDQEVNSGSTNAVSNSAITNYVNGTVLFEGNLASEITLNDSLANYKYIEIFGYATDSVSLSGKKIYTKIENPNNSSFYLNGFDIEESTKILYLKTATCLCENKKITFETNFQWYKQGDGTTGGGSTGNYIRITKVIGYKEV